MPDHKKKGQITVIYIVALAKSISKVPTMFSNVFFYLTK